MIEFAKSERELIIDGLLVSEVEFRPDDGFPLCLGYMVGHDDGVTSLDVSPGEAVRKYRETWTQGDGTP